MRTLVFAVLLSLPNLAAAADYPLLRDAREASLQRALKQAADDLGLSRAFRDEHLAVTVVDLADSGNPRMAGINGQVMFYSASLPKIAILLGAFQRIEDGELRTTPALKRDLVDMIRVSSNAAATRVLDQVGREYLAGLLMSERYRLYDTAQGGGLWVGKAYGAEPAFRRDPLHGISHGATSLQVARFYYLLETGRLVSPAASREMKGILGAPAIAHKFVKGIGGRYPQARIFRKSGTWRDFHSDSALIEHDGKRYIVVALSHDARGGQWLERLVLAVDRLMPALPPGESGPRPR